jgi:hypothetical protein
MSWDERDFLLFLADWQRRRTSDVLGHVVVGQV